MNLEAWMRATSLTDAAMAGRIGVSTFAVRKYRRAERIPTPQIMARIVEATAGQVTANDFYAQHPDTTRAA
ncbi:MAG: helix-turn-helix transcriptional regulator [Gemmatimonadetes bacterium]|nr:helix-turn-helix transcriptional regulator [Gemmatimonadota bacterium]